MNIFRKINLLLLTLVILPLQLLGMECRIEFDVSFTDEFLEEKIEKAQTLLECNELFKAMILIDKDLSQLKKIEKSCDGKWEVTSEQVRLPAKFFSLLGMKKYKILCDIQQTLCEMRQKAIKNKEIPEFDDADCHEVINKGINVRNKYQNTPLHSAANLRDRNAMEKLIQNGANVNARDKQENAPLHVAIKGSGGFLFWTEFLLKNGADVDSRNKHRESPLHCAVSRGYIGLVIMLLEHGANVNVSDDWKDTPLHIAAFNGSVLIANLLIKNGADVNARNKDRRTPLHMTNLAGGNDVVMALFLKQHGAQE